MKVNYQIIVIGLWLLSFVLIILGCTMWSNATVPSVVTGAACAIASEGVINRYEGR